MNKPYSIPSTIWFVLILLLSLFTIQPVLGTELSSLVDNGGYILAANELSPGDAKIQSRGHELFIPASTIKIVTALVALKTLGADFRFTTTFYLDQDHRLFIKGGGDPLLVSEEISEICVQLKKKGIKQISAIILDDTTYQLETAGAQGTEASLQPYDAHNNALAVNFNSIGIRVSAGDKRVSAEAQTPNLPLLYAVKGLPKGNNRINVNQLQSLNLPSSLRYTGELFIALLRNNDIEVGTDTIKTQSTPAHLDPILTWQSRFTLRDALYKCLHYSNNFIANQVFLKLGEYHYGSPATWEKGRRFMNEYVTTTLGISKNEFFMEEGSGLSRKTHLSPYAMIHILDQFKPYYYLLKFNKGNETSFKTGTMLDVYCLAGYIHQPRGLQPFVILLNQKKNSRGAVLKNLIKQNNSHFQTSSLQ